MAYNTTSDRIADRILTTAKTALGKNGLDYAIGTSSDTTLFTAGTYVAIQFVTQSTLAALTIGGCNLFDDECNAIGGTTTLNSTIAIPAGTVLYGDITALKLNDGNSFAILYKA